ncbi:MAG: uroporphyrinogen decarboxylase, partial [Actinobacteria bacterium]
MNEQSLGAEPLLVRTLRREPAERTPVWFMRQAGRSLPEYRELRERHGFFEIAGTPELCAEVTLQPVRRHGVDAAVLFADIMSPVLGMGVDVELVEGRPSRDFVRTKALMYREPATWHALLERLTEQFARYVAATAAAGADAIQLFDSWAGVLSVAD